MSYATREARIAYQRRLRKQLVAKGLCQRCHVTPAQPGFTACPACREVSKASSRAFRATVYKEREAAGICIYCGKQPVREGYRCCQSCIEAKAGSGRQSRALARKRKAETKAAAIADIERMLLNPEKPAPELPPRDIYSDTLVPAIPFEMDEELLQRLNEVRAKKFEELQVLNA